MALCKDMTCCLGLPTLAAGKAQESPNVLFDRMSFLPDVCTAKESPNVLSCLPQCLFASQRFIRGSAAGYWSLAFM